MGFLDIISENKGAIAFVLLVILVGSVGYFVSGNLIGQEKNYSKVFDGVRLKVAYNQDGTINILANSRNNALAKLQATEGNPVPEEESVVFGASEGARMNKTKRFQKIGDRISEFFGLNATAEGVLKKEDNAIDELTFLSRNDMDLVTGEEGKVFATVSVDGTPKLFFDLAINETVPKRFKLAEGGMSGYTKHDLDGTMYYPLIIGAKEAKVMRTQKLFSNTGDTIRGFFGKNFVVAGILEETGTSIDGLHFVPLNQNELN
ncbi:hypothetical protein HZC07_03450 [Candidatus Micrarchaeota archaeon]|nr:hypothetical protein [Candidatus Micrarchaeota archaeon]